MGELLTEPVLAPDSPDGVDEAAEADRVLVVDDEANIRWALGRVLERHGYKCRTAADAEESHDLLDAESFDLAVCDLRLPGESGLDLVRHVLSEHESVAALVVTGRDDPRLAEDLFALGAYGYLVKPFSPSQLVIDVSGALACRRRERGGRSGDEELAPATAERAESLRAAVGDMESLAGEEHGALEEAIGCLARAVELHDGGGAHFERVSARSALLARELGLKPDDCERIRLASQLHDIGKLAVPDSILRKPGPLSADEQAEVEEHPLIGYRILAASRNSVLRLAATIALAHHERFDGLGYPNGLAGNSIPFEARIVTVVDSFDALTNDRPYRTALEIGEAVPIMQAQRGRIFDPRVLDAFLGSLNGAVSLASSPES